MATIESVIPQVDGDTRYLVRTPRGHLGVDVSRGGRVSLTRCTDARGTTARDVREARALVEQSLADGAREG